MSTCRPLREVKLESVEFSQTLNDDSGSSRALKVVFAQYLGL